MFLRFNGERVKTRWWPKSSIVGLHDNGGISIKSCRCVYCFALNQNISWPVQPQCKGFEFAYMICSSVYHAVILKLNNVQIHVHV